MEKQMAKGKMFLDQRAHSRVLVKFPVTFKIVGEKEKGKAVHDMGDFSQQAEARDTSLGGMFLVSDQALKTGDHLCLKISIPKHSNPLTEFADVIWSNETGAGLRFVAMKDEDIKSLEAYLDSLESPQ